MTTVQPEFRVPVGGPQDYFYTTRNTRELPRIVRGEGIFLYDDRGNRLIDVISGAFTASLGQGNERVLRAMYDQGMRHTFSYVRVSRHDPNEAATAMIAKLAGPGFERVHLSSGGSEAVEMAIKFLRQFALAKRETERTQIITLMPSYHGSTLATIGWTGDDDAEAVWGPMAVFGHKVPAPLSFRPPFGTSAYEGALGVIAAMEEKIREIGEHRVLAIMVEPVGGQASGANVPDPVFFSELRKLCDRQGIYLVFDEIVTLGRTGTFLAAHQIEGCRPDLVVSAKGLGAAYTPIGAVLAPASMVDWLAGQTGFNLSHTYNANPISCAASVAVLNELTEHDLIGRAASLGAHLTERLEAIKAISPIVGDVRGKGLIMAIEYVRDKETKEVFGAELMASDRIRQIGLKNGLMLYARRQNGGRFGEWSVICPPLVITESQIDDMVDRLDRTIAQFVDEMTRAGVL